MKTTEKSVKITKMVEITEKKKIIQKKNLKHTNHVEIELFVSYRKMYKEKQQVDNWDQEVCSDRGKFTKTTEFQYWTFCTEMLQLQSGIRINSSSKTHTNEIQKERQQRPTERKKRRNMKNFLFVFSFEGKNIY